ncbi:MAG TPA: class I SAM-dependent methyltransferase [Chitinophagaceae bacterium]|nr:class I SAM-dependent methyltransferase [Chitinophagaceae bacterium]
MISYKDCPCCAQNNIVPVFSAADYTVSQKLFEIWECKDCSLRFTQHVPGEEEIGAYYRSENYISHSDTSQGLVNKLYHRVRKRTLLQKKKLIISATGRQTGSLLDMGAGTGAFLHTMQRAGWQITGLEPDAAARSKAGELYQLHLDIPEKLFSLPEQSFDAITMWHVLEHIHQLHDYLDRLKKLLKPEGRLIIAVPNYMCYDEKVYREYWAAYDVPRHLYHFSPDSMSRLLSLHGMKGIKMKPMWYDSFYVSLLSEKYKTGKSHILAALITGAVSDLRALFDIKKCSSVIYIVKPEN